VQGFGPYPDITLKMAREKHAEAKLQKVQGLDPLAVRDAEREARRAAGARAVTFRAVAVDFIHANRVKWKNLKHASQWEATLKAYAYPLIGDRIVGDLTANDILAVLRQGIGGDGAKPRPLWEARPETASRLRGRIENVLDYAKVRKLRDGDNPAAWGGNLKLALPARSKVKKVENHAALSHKDMPAFMADLRAREAMAARGLEFLILTAARTGEVLGARWGELDLDAACWTVPAERMKAGKEHRVPLSAPALALLHAIRPDDAAPEEFVFPGAKPGRPLSNMAFLVLLKRMKRDDITAHGMRSTFRDWVSESTSFSGDVAERALAHGIKDATEAAYNRTNLYDRRVELMAAWASYCAGPVANVVNLDAQRAAGGVA
jgi:integrase